MGDLIDKLSAKADDTLAKQRKAVEETKAKVKASGLAITGKKYKAPKTAKQKRPPSKVARGMQTLCVIVSVLLAILLVKLDIWPVSLLNGRGVVPVIIVTLPLFIVCMLIAQPIIKRLEKKYGEQAW